MPIKFGSTEYNGKYLVCKRCGYRWEPNSDELTEIKLGHRVSCLHCRAMGNLKPGEVLPKNNQFILSSAVNTQNPGELRGDNYQNKLVDVIHTRCKRTFKIKLIDLRQGNIVCPYCSKSVKVQSNKVQTNSVQNKRTDNSRLVEIISEGQKLEEGTRLPTSQTDKKLGSVLKNGIRVMSIDTSNNTCILQCAKCGAEETRNYSVIKSSKNKEKLLVCSRCASKEGVSLEELKQEYLGKVFNGQSIDDIYYDENGYIMCNLVCLQNKRNTKLESYVAQISNKDSSGAKVSYMPPNELHTQIGVPLGDVINRRNYCPICGRQHITSVAKFKAKLQCPLVALYRHQGKKAELNISDMTVADFYSGVREKSLCDYCSMHDTCEAAGKQVENTLQFISTTMDMEDSLLSDMLSLEEDYPSIFKFDAQSTKRLEIIPDKDLIVFKDAFVDRDGKLFKLCKCRKHGTELTLSDAEIASFKHEQCIDRNEYMRFFRIPGQIYLNIK